jgi:hypothetical protein
LGRILHGGIQSGLFDEIMGWTAMHVTKQVGVTRDRGSLSRQVKGRRENQLGSRDKRCVRYSMYLGDRNVPLNGIGPVQATGGAGASLAHFLIRRSVPRLL